MTELLYVRIFT